MRDVSVAFNNTDITDYETIDDEYESETSSPDDPGSSSGTPGQVIWASRDRYYLYARHFEYLIAGEED